MAARTRLGEVLIDRGLLVPPQLDAALAEQSVSREPLGQILVRRGIVDRSQLAAALNEQGRRWLAVGLTASFLAAHPALAVARMTTAPLTVSVEVLTSATVDVGPRAPGAGLTLTCVSAETLRVTYDRTGIEPLLPAANAAATPYAPPAPYKLSLQPIASTMVACGKSGDVVGVAPPQGAPRDADLSVEVAY
jgi:hypothetical protein